MCPIHVLSYSVDDWQFGFLGRQKKPLVLEAHNIAFLRIPSFHKFLSSRRRDEAYSIWPVSVMENEQDSG